MRVLHGRIPSELPRSRFHVAPERVVVTASTCRGLRLVDRGTRSPTCPIRCRSSLRDSGRVSAARGLAVLLAAVARSRRSAPSWPRWRRVRGFAGRGRLATFGIRTGGLGAVLALFRGSSRAGWRVDAEREQYAVVAHGIGASAVGRRCGGVRSAGRDAVEDAAVKRVHQK